MLISLRDLLAPPLFPWLSLAVGLIVGSFANVCIHRLPLGLSVVSPGSRCPHCGRGIRPWENIPLLSYLLLRGRCAGCRASISPRYPAVEAANGLAWLAIALLLGPTPRGLATLPFVTALLILSLIDLEHQILPDVITLPGVALGLLVSFLPGTPRPLPALLAAVAGLAVMAGVGTGYRWLRGVEGLGQGDWKMTAMLGAFLGWERMLLTVFLATLAGTLVGVPLVLTKGHSMQHKLPLGTFLGAAGIVTVLCGDAILVWYKGLMGVS